MQRFINGQNFQRTIGYSNAITAKWSRIIHLTPFMRGCRQEQRQQIIRKVASHENPRICDMHGDCWQIRRNHAEQRSRDHRAQYVRTLRAQPLRAQTTAPNPPVESRALSSNIAPIAGPSVPSPQARNQDNEKSGQREEMHALLEMMRQQDARFEGMVRCVMLMKDAREPPIHITAPPHHFGVPMRAPTSMQPLRIVCANQVSMPYELVCNTGMPILW